MKSNGRLSVAFYVLAVAFSACTDAATSSPAPEHGEAPVERIAGVPHGDLRYKLEFVSAKEGWLANGASLWRTLNGGATWALMRSSEVNGQEITQLDFLDLKTGWVLTYNDLFHTEDAGVNWAKVGSPLDFPKGELREVRLKSRESGWAIGGIYQEASRKKLMLGYPSNVISPSFDGLLFGAVFHTDDAGKTWRSQLVAGNTGRFIHLYSFEGRLMVIGDAGIFYTDNEGGQWHRARFNRTCVDERLLEFHEGHPTTAAFCENGLGWISYSNGRLVKTTNAGRSWCDLISPDSWRKAGFEGFFLRLHFLNSNDGQGLLDDGSVATTNDGGTTWERVNIDVRFDDFCLLDKSHGWAVGPGGLFRLGP